MNYRKLFQTLEQSLDQIMLSKDRLRTLSAILQILVDAFHDTLGLTSGRIYERDGDFLVLREEYPQATEQRHFRIPVSYKPVQTLLSQGWVLPELNDPGVDADLEGKLGVATFAAIRVGVANRQIIAFTLKDISDREHVIYTLNTIRHVINLKIRQQHLEDSLEQARSIQLSLLPSPAIRYPQYDIWGCINSAEEVGGDLYDFIQVSDRVLGVAVVDSSGHGLPAALQARDAIIGLRMSVEEHLRVSHTITKLNRVISRSALISRFITLFYCELDDRGNLIYCNAGHTPALLYQHGEFTELDQGGLLLGPNPSAQYDRGFAFLQPGSIMVAFTDGILEAESPSGEMFGTERLKEVIRSEPWDSARTLTEAIFEAVDHFSTEQPPRDDQTVVAVIRRLDED
jgi:serine phosphatase RsbU (regulator of sigma subunit)